MDVRWRWFTPSILGVCSVRTPHVLWARGNDLDGGIGSWEPERRLVEIHELADAGAYRVVAELTTGPAADVPACPGLLLPMDALRAKLAELGE